MLDWDALISGEKGPESWDKTHVSQQNTPCVPAPLGHDKSSNGAASGPVFERVPVVPPKNVGKGIDGSVKCDFVDKTAGDLGQGKSFAAANYRQGKPYPVHPSAVLLCIAWMKRADITRQEQIERLLTLVNDPPNEQVRVWSQACRDVGLKPWHVLSVPSSGEGKDCSFCRHLHQEVGRAPGQPENRREFRWACGQGYLILELGRGTERILTAPPDCEIWERWQPRGA